MISNPIPRGFQIVRWIQFLVESLRKTDSIENLAKGWQDVSASVTKLHKPGDLSSIPGTHLNIEGEGWRHGSEVKRTDCYSGGPEFNSTSYMVVHNHPK